MSEPGSESSSNIIAMYAASTGARCPKCEYDLQGIGGECCPECGTALHVELVTNTGAGSAWWWMAMLGLILAEGLAVRLLFTVFAQVQNIAVNPMIKTLIDAGQGSSRALADWRTVVFSTSCCLIMAGALAWLLATRRRFGALPTWQRVCWGVFGLGAPLFYLGAVMTYIDWVA